MAFAWRSALATYILFGGTFHIYFSQTSEGIKTQQTNVSPFGWLGGNLWLCKYSSRSRCGPESIAEPNCWQWTIGYALPLYYSKMQSWYIPFALSALALQCWCGIIVLPTILSTLACPHELWGRLWCLWLCVPCEYYCVFVWFYQITDTIFLSGWFKDSIAMNCFQVGLLEQVL